MSIELLPKSIRKNYEAHEWKHASAILAADFPSEWKDIVDLLTQFKLCRTWINEPGGRKSKVAKAIDEFLYNSGPEEIYDAR